MNKTLLAFALTASVALIALSGCTGSIPAKADSEAAYPQVRTTSYWLQEWTRAHPPIIQRVGAGQVKVSLDVRNMTNHRVRMDARATFLVDGVQVEQSGWHEYLMEAQDSCQVQFTSIGLIAPNPQQKADAMLELREQH